MATIQSFRPARPNTWFAGHLIFKGSQSGSTAESVGMQSLKNLLEAGARRRPETIEGQRHAYGEIRKSFQDLLESYCLLQEKKPGMYVYETSHQGITQTGIWTVTDLEDYNRGKIKVHEHTIADNVRRQKNYRENTGLEGSPVLLTYPQENEIDEIIAISKSNQPKVTLSNEQGLHQLWKIEDEPTLRLLIKLFNKIQTVYLADGHHRLESAAKLAIEQRERGVAAIGHISSLYLSADQLRIEPYERVVVPRTLFLKADLFRLLDADFHINASTDTEPIQPQKAGCMGMRIGREWFHLEVKSHIYDQKNTVDKLDAAILQTHILAPVFGILDPRMDDRLKCAGGVTALEEIGAIFQAHPEAIAFTLCPITVSELMMVADEAQILPPKSTWIVPKIPYGLLIYRHDNAAFNDLTERTYTNAWDN